MRGSSGAGIHCDYGGANPIIDSCVLEGNLYGYQGGAASPQFTYNNQIINNTSYGFYITGSGAPVFGSSLTQWNDIYGNGTYEFYNGASDVYAYYVYWGDTDPSVIASRIFDDNDNTALGIVHFTHWLNEAHGTENTLTAPVIDTITSTADSVHIAWNPVPGASSYRMYSSEKAYSGFQQDLTGIFNGENWTAQITDPMKFFHVTAAAEPEESGSSNTVGFESYQMGTVSATSEATPPGTEPPLRDGRTDDRRQSSPPKRPKVGSQFLPFASWREKIPIPNDQRSPIHSLLAVFFPLRP